MPAKPVLSSCKSHMLLVFSKFQQPLSSLMETLNLEAEAGTRERGALGNPGTVGQFLDPIGVLGVGTSS